MSLNFEWDARKAASNLRKRGVSFDEATSVFGDTLSITIPDQDHSHSERRFIDLGVSHLGHLLVVAFNERGDRIRIISARPATRRERRDYEERTSEI